MPPGTIPSPLHLLTYLIIRITVRYYPQFQMRTVKHLADYRWPQLLWHSSQGRWALCLLPLNLSICAHFWAQALRAEAPTFHLLKQWLWKASVGSQTVKRLLERIHGVAEGLSWAQPSPALPGTRYGSKDTVNAPDQPHYTPVPRMWRGKGGLSGIKKQWKYGNRECETHKKSLGRRERRGTRARMEVYLPWRDG